MNTSQTERQLEHSLIVLADAVAHHGEQYWPLYEMIEGELSRIKQMNRKISLLRSKRDHKV